MDAASLGTSIALYRKKCGLTQSALAQKLNVSAKTISKWENGLGFPEVTQFPALAATFGITIDRLMTGERKGITIAGNIVCDSVKTIDFYPKMGMLSNILEVRPGVGGCAPNTAIDLAKIDRSLPVSAIGRIGDDENGRFILSQLSRHGVDSERIVVSSDMPTSFTDVMSLSGGERTFFHAPGANTEFCPEDIDLSTLNSVILHIGYILLLKKFDEEDPEYGTVMARFLHDAQARGFKTSVDVVSDSTADYKAKILPALKYCDYAIMNEIESTAISDLSPRHENGKIHVENIRRTMEIMAESGVRERVVVHCKEAGFCLDVPTGEFAIVPTLDIPKSMIKGSVGAGDAFCAGCLYGIYHGYDPKHLLEFASAVACSNLFAENSTDGILCKEELDQMEAKYGRETL